jgi:glycosyltransferase involved in cell wall biosynthesis
MNILYMAGREHGYQRNDVLLRALRRAGHVQVVGAARSKSLMWTSAIVFARALPYLLTRRYDLVFVGFYGHLLMLPVGLLSRAPILFDAFVSNYDTLCFDRQIFAPRSLPGRLAFWLDQSSCRLATFVLVDTQLQAEYFRHTFHLAPERVGALPVGCNEDLFSPQPPSPRENVTAVLYYSTFQPLHGVETVVRAAHLLGGESRLRFKLIGTGPDYAQVRRLAENLRVENIAFLPTVPLETLVNEIATADICLGGPFGHSDKASRVIPGKIYQILAMERPLLAADSPANRELLTHGETAYLCQQDSPEDLAAAILKLHQDTALREGLAQTGRALYLKRCSEAIIAEQLRRWLNETIQ